MIGVIDYGLGNLGSILNMFRKVGADAIISADPRVLADMDKLVLPGVGAFDHGMHNLAERGLLEMLHHKALVERVPILGLCLGMQLMTQRSEEGSLPGLGWIEGETVRFDLPRERGLPTLHMGWNTLEPQREHPLLDQLDAQPRFYFVHAYHAVCRNERNVLATTTYGYSFASAIVERNIAGLQCHPEKSHRFGMAVFRSFAQLSSQTAAVPSAT